MAIRQTARHMATTLLLAAALTTFGCRQPLHGADMTKPVTKQAERLEDVKPDKKPLGIVPVLRDNDQKGKEEDPGNQLKFKEHKKGKHIEFK